MDAVVDTNILVSGLLSSSGRAAQIVQMITAGQLQPAYDDRILFEYESVLRRKKFGFQAETIDWFLQSIKVLGVQVIPPRVPVDLPDEDDRCFYECALACTSKILITGNAKHFPSHVCSGIRRLSLRDFLTFLQ